MDIITYKKLKDVSEQLSDIVNNKAEKTEVTTVNSRVDNIVTPNGDPSLTELSDIRVASDGTVYPTAGTLTRIVEKRTTPLVNQSEDTFYITDSNGNIKMKVDNDGIDVAGSGVKDLINTYEDSFYICDSNGNFIFKADRNGISGLNLGSSSASNNPYQGMKLITIGDSLSAHDKWQKWLVEWLGVEFDLDENLNGSSGYAPMAVGGTAVIPNSTSSIYIRALDAVHYADTTNGTVIVVYAGQNDIPNFGGSTSVNAGLFGTINDIPYLENTVYSSVATPSYTVAYEKVPTTYAYCMGLIQKLITNIPSAKIFIVTPMQMWTSDNSQSVGRKALVNMWKEIGDKYGMPVVDLWGESGASSFNGSNYYVTTGDVHPSENGYKNGTALTIYRKMI